MTDTAVTLLFTERPGAVDRIVSLLRRRGFPVGGMTIERTHRAGTSRMTVSVRQPDAVEQVTRHLERLADVIEARPAGQNAICREYALARVHVDEAQRDGISALMASFDARPVSTGAGTIVLEATGTSERIDALFAELAPYGIEESARTNTIALGCGAGA